MNNSSRNATTSDFCKSHSARTDREPCKTPSTLSKKELEDHYYNLLDANMTLKKTVNSQQDQLRVMSAKILRLTGVLKGQGRTNSCCVGVKAVVDEQKECINDLKRSNMRLTEKIKTLNMRLCSTKQFLKSPGQAKCFKCSRISLAKRASSVSGINTKRSDANIQTTSVSCQYYDNIDILSAKSVRTEVSQLKDTSNVQCQDNKCRSEIEEMRNEITLLKEELATTQTTQTEKVAQLEQDLSRSQAESSRARAELHLYEEREKEREERCRGVAERARGAEARCNDLTMQLFLEKQKSSELETQLKSFNLSTQIAKTIEDHLTNEVQKRNITPMKIHYCDCGKSPSKALLRVDQPQSPANVSKVSKCSEDSGFIDPNRSTEVDEKVQSFDKINSQLITRIANLQTQFDELKMITVEQSKHKETEIKTSSSSKIIDPDHKRIEDEYLSPKSTSTEVNETIQRKPSIKDKEVKEIKKHIEQVQDTSKVIHNDVQNKFKTIVKTKIIDKDNKTDFKTKLQDTIKPKDFELSENEVKIDEGQKRSGTYSIRSKKVNSMRTSPDDTEYEISSISNSPGKASPSRASRHRSLGERRSPLSESYTVTSSESDTLSEGEVPFRASEILSIGERPVDVKIRSPFPNPHEPLSKKIDSTLQAITTEMARCARLLQTQQSA